MTNIAPLTTAEARVAVRADANSYAPPWADFADLMAEVGRDDNCTFLIAIDDDATSRREWTRSEWRELADAIGNQLQKEGGVATGDRVATLCLNTPQGLAFAFATWLLGACLVPLDPGDDDVRHAEILRDSGARLLCVGADDDLAQRARRHEGVKTIVFDTGHAERGRGVRHEGDVGQQRPVGTLTLPALRIYTSGTTGRPKAVVLTMRGILINCAAMKEAFGWDENTRVLTVLPIQHVNGLLINCFLAWYAGASTVLWDRFRSAGFWRVAADTGATTSSLVPTVLEFLLATPPETLPDNRLSEVISGSAPLRVETAQNFERSFGVPVRQLYGLSETSAVLTVTPTDSIDDQSKELRASVGAAVAHADVRVVDPAGRPCGEDEPGELVARGGMIMLGYGDDEADSTAFAGGWFHTGDSGRWKRGPDGRPWFFIEGRMRDSIMRGGLTIAPRPVEEVAELHPHVLSAAAFPMPNRWYGEEVGLCVTTDRPLSEGEILSFCAERLARNSRPKAVFFLNEMPTTRMGKLRRSALVDLFRGRLVDLWNNSFSERDLTQ